MAHRRRGARGGALPPIPPPVAVRQPGILAAVAHLRRFDGVVSVGWGPPRRRGRWLARPALIAHVRWKRDRPPRETLPREIQGFAVDVVELVPGRTLGDGFFDQSDFVKAEAPSRKSSLTILGASSEEVLALVSGHGTLRPVGDSFVVSPGDRVSIHDPLLGAAFGTIQKGAVAQGYDFAYVRFDVGAQPRWNNWHEVAGMPPVGVRLAPLAAHEPLLHYSRLAGRRRPVWGVYRSDILHDVELDDGAVGKVNLGWLHMVDSDGEPFALPGDSGSLVVDSDHRAVGVIVGSTGNHASAYVMSLLGARFLDESMFTRLFAEIA